MTVDDLIAARSEAKNDMGDINALLSAIELSLVEKLKDHNLSKFAFDKTFRLIDIAKTQADLSQDYHNGELAQLTGGQYQLDELKNIYYTPRGCPRDASNQHKSFSSSECGHL